MRMSKSQTSTTDATRNQLFICLRNRVDVCQVHSLSLKPYYISGTAAFRLRLACPYTCTLASQYILRTMSGAEGSEKGDSLLSGLDVQISMLRGES
jgi:hypothetical protein